MLCSIDFIAIQRLIMAHRFPSDTKLQHFFHEQYGKESTARLDWYFQKKQNQSSGDKSKSFSRSRSANALTQGLPTINPTEFAIKKKRQEDENLQRIIAEARQQFRKEEMYPPKKEQVEKLFDGFTREGKGRYQYLADRHQVIPEEKFTFPILSSWKHGWKLSEETVPARPTNARTKLIRDTFYKRNGIPTLTTPAATMTLERG